MVASSPIRARSPASNRSSPPLGKGPLPPDVVHPPLLGRATRLHRLRLRVRHGVPQACRIVRTRSTTSDRLLHGVILLPSWISVAGTGKGYVTRARCLFIWSCFFFFFFIDLGWVPGRQPGIARMDVVLLLSFVFVRSRTLLLLLMIM
uniref:Predicted protein n=1 Tax=Hordeum vulgare subsp. vulgare TaxID=112509 RepID=F2D109_HORVV|nr:predicted protein [Hordeum vulgare subsp. vulgare]